MPASTSGNPVRPWHQASNLWPGASYSISAKRSTPDDPTDRTRLCVDADIDLYRGTVAHLFGEVLVNHLTGSKTDQFRVWDTLVGNEVTPLGGFEVIRI